MFKKVNFLFLFVAAFIAATIVFSPAADAAPSPEAVTKEEVAPPVIGEARSVVDATPQQLVEAVVVPTGIRLATTESSRVALDQFLVKTIGGNRFSKERTYKVAFGERVWEFYLEIPAAEKEVVATEAMAFFSELQTTGGDAVKMQKYIEKRKTNVGALLWGIFKTYVPFMGAVDGWSRALGHQSEAIGIVDGLLIVNGPGLGNQNPF